MALSISAIIPTYNRAHLVGRAITSVLKQLDDDDEVIVVDDGSDDNTEEVVLTFERRVKYLRTPNRGAGAARNTGVKEACNQLIVFCDSDDEWLPGKIGIQRSLMQAQPDILFCFSNFSCEEIPEVCEHEEIFFVWRLDMKPWDEILNSCHKMSSFIPLPTNMQDFNIYVGKIYLAALTNLYMSVNTLMVRKEEAAEALHFAEDTLTFEEWECFGLLAGAGKCAYLDIKTAYHHSHSGIRLTDAHITERAQARVTILPRVWGSDKEFLQKHHELYHRILDADRLTLIDGLLVRGETAKARLELKQITGRTSLIRNLLAAFPGSITKRLLALRRALKS